MTLPFAVTIKTPSSNVRSRISERLAWRTGAGDPSIASVRQQLERIISAPSFSRSERLKRFLRFVVEETLAGRRGDLKEFAVADAVYDRGLAFNPATDTIVRVEARRLRSTLEKYYADEGREDAVLIEIPKGAYEPVFSWKQSLGRLFEDAGSPPFVAVLPFKDLRVDRGQDRFCDGITAEITNALTQFEGVRVAAHSFGCSSPCLYKDIREICQALNVSAVVEGSVRRAGDRLRVTAQLVSTTHGFHLWSQRFDRRISDAFAIQDEVAGAVVEALRQRSAAAMGSLSQSSLRGKSRNI